ncbi:substrate-binding periplasmic protein [Psychromonas aquimarina]|uniref:substrate-binding periplasmic protein n=1 Tax=Psychromonas aquimarina TaxID=444919 RepID=UPI000429433F|nr:transporter substrate-binding domain-containing protein [Psychromonas aquimarina]
MDSLFKLKMSFTPFFLVLLFLSSPASSEQPTLKAIGHHDYAPWNWEKDNQIVGAAAEITAVLFKKAGANIDLTYLGPWKRGQGFVEHGVADINICAFINEQRKAYSVFIETPMGFIEQALFVKKGKEFPFNSWQDLKNKKVALLFGVSLGTKFDDFLNNNVKVFRANNYQLLFRQLKSERIDAVVIGRNSGQAILEAYGFAEDIVSLPNPVLTGKLYISMSKKSNYLHLLPLVEKQMQQQGYYQWVDKLLAKYTYIYQSDYQSENSTE